MLEVKIIVRGCSATQELKLEKRCWNISRIAAEGRKVWYEIELELD